MWCIELEKWEGRLIRCSIRKIAITGGKIVEADSLVPISGLVIFSKSL